jgi:hypothetical protein
MADDDDSGRANYDAWAFDHHARRTHDHFAVLAVAPMHLDDFTRPRIDRKQVKTRCCDEPLKTMHAAGHDDLRTTMIYVNEAQVWRSAHATFPA